MALFFLIVGPSGVGKGTVVTALKQRFTDDSRYFFPITATTRAPRKGEVDGEDYYFLSREEFQKRIEEEQFLEHAIVHDKEYYGLPKESVLKALEKGQNIIRELDTQGFSSIRSLLPPKTLYSIFLLPPSMDSLKQRIFSREPVSEEELARRMESAESEMMHACECNARIVSKEGQIEELINAVEKIIAEEIEKEKVEKIE